MFRKGLICLRCCVKILTFLFWLSLCLMTMRLALFKSNPPQVQRKWMLPDNYTKMLYRELGEDDPELDYQLDIDGYLAIASQMSQRASRVKEVCQKYGMTNQKLNSREFFINYKHNFVWCPIFKAASTAWLYNINILAGYDKKFLSKTRTLPLTLARRKFPRPNEKELRNIMKKPDVTSFLFVREPFVRLLSAYRDKLEHNLNKYYRKLSKSIIKEHRKNATKIFGPIKSLGPTFYEFVSYLIAQHGSKKRSFFNEHWAPYYRFCSPCGVKFSIIGKVENLTRDTAYLIKKLGLASNISSHLTVSTRHKPNKLLINKARDGRNTTTLLKKYYSQLDDNTLNHLLSIYGIDFEMFGYDPKVYSTYVKK